MKLIRLKLDNWRGVDAREIQFADGVTLIEGPNEIGKSTIVEALRVLFETLHSSSAAGIKAIQPVGQDVGSSVEAEIEAGGYHFIYGKTYNRDKQAVLKVLQPQAEQLTGREAHERAEQILAETVDMALWNALLVEQGGEIAGVTLSQSNGLARALDEAAGGASFEQDESDLFARAQVEYEKYFTLKSAKAKYASMADELAKARLAMEEAKAALADIENDAASHARASAEINRLQEMLPELRVAVSEHEQQWQRVSSIKDQLTAKQKELMTAQELTKSANEDQQRRKKLELSVAEGQAQLKEVHEQLAPQLAEVNALKAAADEAGVVLLEAKQHLKQAREAAELSRADEQHLQAVLALNEAKQQLQQFNEHSQKLDAARKTLQSIKIDGEGLEKIRESERALEVALGRLNTVASAIEIEALADLKLSLNDKPLELKAGAIDQRTVSTVLRLSVPGVANIRFVPSRSANELEADAEEHKQRLTRLLEQYTVKDLADAIATYDQRATAEQAVKQWTDRIDALLKGESITSLQTHAENLQNRCDSYLGRRSKEPVLPDNPQTAASIREAAVQNLKQAEERIEQLQAAADNAGHAYNEANANHKVAQQNAVGLERTVAERKHQLEEAQATEDDATLNSRVAERQTKVAALTEETHALAEQFESASPETVEALLNNARATSLRAENDLREQKTQLAILEDRLTKAQANGLFETLETAELECASLEASYAATHARANAAKRLWDTLNKYRDASRKAYVQPLKAGIEQLGRIVFGADFSVELGDDWELINRTQAGKTIPFDDLSVGAREQLGILTRLAAARIVSNQGGVPLIIDDALGFSDPGRLKTMGAAIAAAGQDCQVILLTCTPGRFTHVGSAQVVRL